MLYGMRLPFNHLMYFIIPESVCILLTKNVHSFFMFLCILYTLPVVFCKFLEPNMCFTIKKGLSVSITKKEAPLHLPAGGLESKSRPQDLLQ